MLLNTGNPQNNSVSVRKKILINVWDMVKVVCISLAIIIPVRYFLIQPFYVKGASMEPNFFDHEYLIINEIGYRIDDPQRGDIVVFKYPKDQSQYFIKRIVGLPGEKIEVKDGHVYIYKDEKKYLLDETQYLPTDVRTNGDYGWQLAENEYYVLGDNREFSLDSRSFGPVDQKLIIGKAWVRGWPFNRVATFGTIDYNF
ncbi:MAG: signal peptidase I [Candidatus Falkowbacteria bacterium]